MPTTPSMAKNVIRRSLWNLVDPGPTKAFKEKIWAHFDSNCAYCGVELGRNNRQGHIDHLIPISSDSHSGRSIYVLSCGNCNSDNKRDRDWREFLREVCAADAEAFDSRRDLIEGWIDMNADASKKLEPEVVDALYTAEDAIIAVFESHVQNIRAQMANLKE